MKEVVQETKQDQPPRTKKKSGTAYPYYDLNQSIEVAEAVHNKGGSQCSKDQLASFLSYSTVQSGAYLTRIAAAKLFGLINIERDQISTTERANTILSPIMPEDQQNEKVDAFLDVPLFNAVYEQFKGSSLPLQVGLKNLLEKTYSIVPKRVTPTLRVLMSSARQAGFFEIGGDTKLIKPVADKTPPHLKDPPPDDPPPDPKPPKPKGGGEGPPPGIHTAITGLLRELPPPGSDWPQKSKKRFMDAFTATIDFIYPSDSKEGGS